MEFAPIHNHSQYSALDGLATPEEIAQRCLKIGCSCCGVTDHGTVAGHLEFGKVMAKHGIKPVYGCELYHGTKTVFGKQERDQAHFVAGALSDEGLRNLWRLVDDASTNYRFVGRVNWDMLSKRREGLFATSACIQGLVSKGVLSGDPYEPLNRYLEVFGDNFYIELHTYPGEEHEKLNLELANLARERGIPLTYATDAHFADPDQYFIHDAFVAAQTGDNIYMDREDRKMWHPKSLYIQDEAQIRASLGYLPESVVDEALRNSSELAERCNAQLPEIKRHLPAFIPSECPWLKTTDPADKVFLDLVAQGIETRYGSDPSEEVRERAEYEAEVFLEAGLEHFFLQTWDFCEFCNRKGIKRGPGRGSTAGVLIAYLLGITDVDPLKYGLILERWYNPGRAKGLPDIDNDFPVSDRKRVREYLMDRWGRDKVRTIGTTTRLKPKAVIDKFYKTCSITFEEKEALKKIIDNVPDLDILGSDSIGWDEKIDPGKTIYVMEHVGDDILKWLGEQPAERIPYLEKWLSIIRVVCSRVSGYGVHPSGVVVSDVSLNDELPCMYNRKQEVQVTCFPMADVDARMFVKQDLLGLRNLDTLQDWEDQVSPHVGAIDWSNLDDSEMPEEMWQLLDNGLSLGIFQIERGYARKLCKEFKPRSIEDLGIIVALNRPGPIRSGAPDSFIRRRRGEERVTYDHPILEDLLDSTYGWFLYQEQVIFFFEKLGYTKSEADAVRKILGKKKPEEMAKLKIGEGEWAGRGYQVLAQAAGIDQRSADIIWDKLEDFAKYSFNKSHAIAYATVAFRTLFAKFYASAEFIMACIRTNPDDAGDYVGEGRRMDIRVLPPDVQRSEPEIAVVDGDILFGLSNIKGIGKAAGRYITDLRQKYDIYTPEDLSDVLEIENAAWERRRDVAKAYDEPFKERSPKQQLPANRIPALYDAGGFDEYYVRDINLRDKQKLQQELLGVIVTDDVDEVFARHGEELTDCDSYAELESEGNNVIVPGVVATITPKKTKKDNKPMGIVTIEYEGDQTEFVVFPREWAAYKFLWQERTPGLFSLSVTDRGVKFNQATRLT